ncbi:GDSL-like Lipase/Acylhydrolase family protein [Nocardioides scoriae]|uniref:GDSL-like Lipase/Acylhydrolase family protein n=1 Tax=Nocardioides scoriae TaxID=642780 RepID=A0A1H1L753_9ACTN|nr:SGNH/GDSL hydrolase family protein [Nocardioides scoriae]SDR69865.1 GDSL-like Lipase/Acylhydrolase family protein [Nocardioides scoriae]
MRRRLLALSLTAASVLTAGLVTAAPSSATGSTAGSGASSTTGTPGTAYVALGDSYSAASGVLPLDPTAPPSCLRSTRNYPHVIAARTGAVLRDVTCGAAETKDYRESQGPGIAPQLDALGAGTELVTMTIGGNDSGVFIGAITKCGAAGTTTLGRGNPCERRYGSSFEDTIRTTTYPALVQALQDVRAKAPNARVAILGYPWIVPTSGRCYPQLPVADGDVPYLRSLQATLNDAVARAAAATGSTYVDLDGVSEGHDACKPLGTRWIEPVVGTTNPVIVHPNALGERKMADRAMAVLGLG